MATIVVSVKYNTINSYFKGVWCSCLEHEWSIHVELRKRRLVIIPIIKKEQSLTVNVVFSLAKYDKLTWK